MVDMHHERPTRKSVGVWARWPVKRESYRHRSRYPESLMAQGGIGIGGYTITFHDVTANQPEAESAGRQLFDHVVNLIEDTIISFDPSAIPDK